MRRDSERLAIAARSREARDPADRDGSRLAAAFPGWLPGPPQPVQESPAAIVASATKDGGRRGGFLTRIAVRSVNRIVIVPVHEIARLEAEDNYVRIWADRPYLTKETLTGLLARLDPGEFLRIHRSHAVNIRLVRELRPQLHGEYLVLLANGTELVSGRSYRSRIQEAFGLLRASEET